MTDNKKYIINVGDQAEEWTSDMYAQKGDSLFAKYKDAEVFEVEDAADFDEDPTDHQYIINVGDESEVWDGDMVKEKGARLKEAYPDVKIQRVSYKDYWGEQATANREQRALLAQPDQERNAKLADLGYYDDITGEAFSYTQSEEGVPQWGPSLGLQPLSSIVGENEDGTTSYADPKVAEFFASDTSYTDRQAEIARLDAEYESNPSVIAQREYEAQWRADQAKYNDTLEAQIRKDAEADGVGDAQRRQNRKMAPMLGMGNPMLVAQYNAMYADAELSTKQSENYASALNMMEKIKELQKVSEKGFGGATLDVAKEKFESWREPDIALYNRVGDILTNLEAEFKDEGLTPENLTPEVLEQHLSNDEKALILAFFQYNSALEDAQQDMSAWYKGGKIFAESVPFMLEFLATGGLYKAAGSAATKGMAGALKKWVLGAAKGSVKRTLRKGAAVALRDLVYAGVGTLARTVVSPGTYNRMAEESVKIEDGHLDRTKNVFKSFADSYIENLSEISGGLIGKGLGLLGKGIGKAASMSGIPFSKLGSMLADNKLMQTIAAGWKSVAPKFEALGFHGLFEEIGEEYIGNAIREFTIQPGALAEMHKDDNFGAMLIGFAPMTLFGGAMSAVSIGAKNIEAANLGKKLRETLGQHYSEEQIDHMMNLVSGAENAEAVWEAIKPLTVGLNTEETQQLFQYGAFMAQNKAMLFAKKAQDDNLAQAKRAELQQTYSKFWQQNAEGAESVQIATLDDGRTVYVVSEPTADGVVSIIDAASGAKGFTNVSNYRTQEVDGAATPMTQTWSMNAYLEAEIASERRTGEQTRMQREYNEQVQNLQSQIQEGTRINLGTEGNPVIMLATGKFVKDGVVAVDQTGNTHTIGWNQVADAMKQPIRVKTDQQLIDEEMAAIVARNAERRKRMTDADPAMTDAVNESAVQSAEVVAQEDRHIPMNEDGTVNEAAFWEQDPEGYVQWNDEQNQDGGADSLQQVAITKAVLTSLLAEAQQAQQTSNPAERKAAKQRALEIAEKINRLTAIEASYAEQRIAPLRERAMKWKSLTNAPVYIVETEEDLASISGQAAESNKGGARVRGFAKDGKAYIYLPGIVEESEIDAVFMHEAVAHTGLKGLLGQQAFDELCDQVWEMMSPEMQTVFINYPGVNGNTRAAADEYIAHLAETMGAGIAEAEEKTIWQSIIDFVRNILRSMGIALNVSESELSDLIHMAYADLAKNMAEAEDIAVQQQEARVAEREAPSAARQEYDTYAEDLTHDEIKAVAANDFNAAQEAYDALAASAPKVEMGESAKDFIARKKAYNEQLAEAKAALDARQALMDEIARIDAANAPVLTDAEVLEQEGLGVDTQNDDVRMSVRYVPTEKQREMIIGSIMNVTGRTREEAERWLASETSLAAMINEDLQYLDYVADPKYKAIKDNSDYPQGTVDFNNICRKRLPFTRMFTRLQRRFPNRVFTAEELADIRTIMSKDDLMVACGLCYVEDRRQMVGEVAQSFIDGLQEQFKTYANNPTKKKNAKKFNELIAGDTYVPQVYDLTTQEGLDKLYNEHRGIWEAFQAFNNARGQQSQNLLQGYAEYKREILSWSDKKVKSVNDNGGLRIFSYSDFEAHHLIDVVQIIIDCAAKGVKIQGYTKVPEFARAVADTGIKLNRSLIPLGDTGLVDGQLAFDPVEGIDINDPNFLESNDNVGNILIGINDEQIRIAMADPRIHYIIPYHARQKENIRQKLNVGAWTNYISTQNERNISDGKRVKDNINIYTDILTGDVTTDRQFVEKYLQLCKEKGRIPKFDQFLERDAEGNYLYTPGYYKFLVDFKLFDENGNILPQQPVVAEFDDAFNMQILENYAKDEREGTGEQMNETYDKIVDALGLDESAAEGEDVRFSTVKEIADKFNAELQQQIDGTLPDGHVYQLGVPGAVLASTGIPNLPITLQASVLNVKANDPLHPFALEEIRDLVPAIQRPWAIFKYGDSGKAQNLIVGIAKEDKQFLVGLSLNPTVKGKTLYINSVRNVFPKDNHEWLNWIQQGKLLRVDEKEKIQAIIDALRINPVDYTHLDLDSIAKVVKEFENPSIDAENEEFRFSVRTDEQREKLFEDAKARFGLTNNFKVAGYMLPDGSLLDFSEANDGGDPNQRTLDHREIEGIIMDEGKEYDSRWMYLADFMNEGAIRLLPEYAGINLMKAPTKEQRSRLFDFIYKYNGEVILEIADERLNNVAYVEYDRRTSPSRIFRDIDGYFNEGIVPQQDVRFSVFEPHNATIDEIDGLFREYNMDESLIPLYDKVSALAHSMDLKIRFDYPWSAAAGSTFGDKVKFNTEFFNSLAYKSQDKAHALLHEMIHATTNYAIAARNTGALTEGMKEAVSQLEGIYGEIVNDSAFDGTYGAKSIYEMVAELSNPEFRSLLKEKNLFQRIVDAIKRLLGIEVGENALDNLSATLDYMLDNYDGRVFGAVVNQYQKHQEYTRFSAVQIDPAVRQEMDTIKAKAMWDGTFMKAPNGADTNLTEEQWLMVRTKNFINWFGDWINDPENASKVVDENGEPMVVYHGTNEEFNVFGESASRFGVRGNIFGDGYYFSSSKEVAEEYANRYQATIINGERIPVTTRRVIPAFLNIVDMIDIKSLADWKGEYQRQKVRIWNEKSKTADGLVVRSIKDGSNISADTYLVHNSANIKSATETTGLFSESEDIRYSSRFDVNTNPTEAQKKAGNYKMGHLRLDGYNITIENPKGSVRRGTDSKGNEWENTLNNDYGYIRGTEGVDGDHIDVYLSDNPAEGNVFVIDQVNPETREFDEHKVMYGFNSIDEAREAYLANFSEGWNGLGTITEVTKDEFKKWIDSSHRKTKPFSEYKSVKAEGAQSEGYKEVDIRFSAITEAELEENSTSFSVVTDPALLDQLNNEEYITLYRAMQLVDGKLYPPMAGKVAFKEGEEASWGEPTPEQMWLQSDETPWNAVHARYDEDSKDGKHKKGDLKYDKNGDPVWVFKLDKGNGKTLYAAYNPYIHTSASPLNDQFSEAQSRSNLVVVRVLVPKSELTSGYKAEKAKDSVGMKPWHKGPISGVLAQYEGKGREVMLTRYAKIDGIVDFSEVADETIRLFEGTGLLEHPLPTNVFMPGLREELEKRGVQFVETTNKGEIKEGEHKGKTWASVYGKDGLGKKPTDPNKPKTSKKSKKEGVRFSVVPTSTNVDAARALSRLDAIGMDFESQVIAVRDEIEAIKKKVKRLTSMERTPSVIEDLKAIRDRMEILEAQAEMLRQVEEQMLDTKPISPDYDRYLDMKEPQSVDEYIADLLTMRTSPVTVTTVEGPDGKKKTIRQGGKKIGIMLTPETLERELGYSKSDWEGIKYIVSAKDGMSLDAIAEMISEDSGNNWMFNGMDTMEIKDAIINFLMSVESYSEIRDYIENERRHMAEEEADTISGYKYAQAEQYAQSQGMSINEYNEWVIQQAREARENWLEGAENPEEFAKFEQSNNSEYEETDKDTATEERGEEDGAREEESKDASRGSDTVGTRDGAASDGAETSEEGPSGESDGDLPGDDRGPGDGGGKSRGTDGSDEAGDSGAAVVSTDVEASDRGVDELVEEGKQKAERAGADFMDAITAINGKLSDLHRAAAAQREYDKATIQIVTSLANELLEKGKLSDLTRGEIKRLIATLKDSVGKKDLTITFDRLMNLLITNQLRLGRERFEEFLKIKASKVDARGVEVKGKLDIPGQRVIGALKEGIGLDVDTLAERISDCEDKLSSGSETVRRNAEIDLVGYKLALNYMVDIKASQIEEKNLRKSLADAKEDYDAGEMTKEAYKEFQKSVYNAIRENRIERVNAYEQILDKLAKIVKRSILGAEWMNDAEKQRVERIHHFANSDMQGMPAAEHERKESLFWNNPVTRFLLKPFATFDQMLRSFAPKSRNGEGYLWNHFMGGWLKATENEYKGIQAAHNILDAKAREVFGSAVKRWSDIFVLERSMPKAEVTFWDDGQFKTYEIPQGNLLYIYMVNKMSDGKMKLRRMGITEEDVDAIVANLSPEFIEIANWLQNDFLPGLREKYNALHEKLFGAPMAAIDNYFPIKVNANSRTRDIDLGIGEMEGKPSTITGSIIKRTKNALALDILHSDAFDVVLGHIEEMEHWAAFAEWNQDLNSLLSYRKFRNRVQNTSGIYGAGTTAWNSFKATAEIAAGVYKPATRADSVDKTIMNIAKGVTGSKIAFRVYTAFKQLLSWPAFLADANWAILAKNFATPAKAWTWSMENLPLFEKRWKSRQAGDSRLMETDADWKIWKSKVVEIAGRLGMTPNAFIDALTVAIGSRSVYETKVKEYLKDGYTQEEAEEKAKRDATVSFNESQQSNESAFLSQVQLDRTVASVVFTVFRNSSMGYQRQYVDAIRNMVHMLKPNYREQSVEYMRKQMVRDGLSEEQAERAANRIYNRSFTRNALKALTFGFVVQFAWNLGPSLVYMLLGDDDEEKRAAAKDAAVRALVGGPVEGMASGNVISNVLGNIAMGEDLSTVSGVQLPAVSDLENVVTLWENDKVRATNEVFNLLISSGLGFSPQTITDAVVSIIDAAGGDLKASTEITLALLRILQVPQSQTEKLFMDEIDMKADDAYDMTVEEFAQRYARYRKNRSAGPFVPFYSDEDERKREEQYIKMFTQKADEARRTRGSEVAQKFFEYYDNGYEEVRKTIGEMQREIKDFSINELIDDAEQTEARLQEFMKTEEFEKYAELTPYIKMYEGYKDLLKKIDNPDTRMEYAREMTKAMTEMVKIMEDME